MKKIVIIFFVALAGSILWACTDVLDVTPKASLTDETLLNEEGLDALVVSCYAILNNGDPQPAWGWGNVGSNLLNNASLWESGDLRSDDAYKGGGGTSDVAEYGNIEVGILEPTNLAFQVIWKGHYVSISRCNRALQLLDQVTDEEMPARATRRAEVLTLRGYYYMRMKQLYRSFPYIDESVQAGEEGEVPNNLSDADLWSRIVADLSAGKAIDPAGQEAGRINRNISNALLAKAYILQNNYTEALTAADDVINSGTYRLLEDLEGLYSDPALERAGENIFAFEASVGGGAEGNVIFNWGDIWVAPSNGPYGGGDGFQRPSQNLVNAFKVDANGLPLFDTFNDAPLAADDITTPVDPRLDHAIGRPGIRWKDYTASPQTIEWARSEAVYGPFVKKKNLIYVNSPFRATAATDFPWAGGALNLPFVKYSEMLLIKAECLVELNQNLDEARTIINQIRERAANTSPVADFNDPSQPAANYQIGTYDDPAQWTQAYAREAVRWERRLELCLEGHRYFDLKRWGVIKETLDRYFATESALRPYLGSATYQDGKHDFYPVPQTEIDISRGVLAQDPNY
ncbi:MAG: RagB/SusD family nutrient uptake outer membrane protein [Bacteroidota bacterium]